MQNIITVLNSKSELINTLRDWLKSFYKIDYDRNIDNAIQNLNGFINEFQDDLKYLVEFPYVDKFYRDSYYHYFSSKKITYSRDCIRVSIFNTEIEKENQHEVDVIERNYLGFLILRPTFPKIIGRNVINPNAFKNDPINICSYDAHSTANFLRIKSCGFPHSTQDTEMISCAETTLWSIVEYFSSRYSDYPPLLPSEIHNILSQFSFERQIPSKGLRAAQISYALKKIGFGVRIYSKNAFDVEFDTNLRVYIESGIHQ